MSLKNKVAIVTGASSGIGAATAVILAREGASVVLVGRNEANLNIVAEKCGKQVLAIKADVCNESDAGIIINKTIEKFGKLDVLVNNAGILRHCPILDKNLVQNFDEVIRTNLRSVIMLTHLAAPYLIKTKGNIVNVSSVAGSRANPFQTMSVYCTSKAGLNHFTKCAAQELADYGVRVNTVSPGPVDTPIFKTAESPMSWDFLRNVTALNKITQPEEVGEIIAFIASDKASSITGANYAIDCGVIVKYNNNVSHDQCLKT